MADYISVSALNRMVRRVLDDCAPLSDVIVCGELSGFTRHYKSGHLYFTLKDENAGVKGVKSIKFHKFRSVLLGF